MSQQFKLPGRLRIKSRKDTGLLFENEKSLFSHPLLLKYEIVNIPEQSEGYVQFAVSVPKRNYRKATVRNTLKRRVREAYRLNWISILSPVPGKKILLMFIVTGKQEYNYSELERSLKSLLQKLNKSLISTTIESEDLNDIDLYKRGSE